MQTQVIPTIPSVEAARRYVAECEAQFSSHIDDALERLIGEGNGVKTVALAGPTCSGKTTIAVKLSERIRRAGKKAVVFSIDDFFLGRADRNVVRDEAPDYDSAAALDLDYFGSFMDRLNRGLSVLVPHFDFSVTSRTGYDEYIPDEDDIYVFEGIQAVYPEITRFFAPGYGSVFISVQDEVVYRGVVLSRNEIRLLRRIVRDWNFRGALPEFTLHLWESVRANEEKNIFPNALKCDFKLNSLLPYEPFALSRCAAPLLRAVPEESRYRAGAEELAGRLAAFDCPYLEERMIPENSVFREFIG